MERSEPHRNRNRYLFKVGSPQCLIPARLFIHHRKIFHVKGSSHEAWNPRPGWDLDALYPATVIEAPLLGSEQPRDKLHHLDDPSCPPPQAPLLPLPPRSPAGNGYSRATFAGVSGHCM